LDLTASTWWWIACGVLVALELATGTFYLLMLAIGAAAAAVAAHAGLAITGQLVTGALVGGGAVVGWHRAHGTAPAPDPASENRDVNLDVGERLTVERWQPDGTAQVKYRGAMWAARFDGAGPPAPGPHVIRAVDGNRLLLARASS
jgi:membrane protein implicated in regulation of membrane protease activity